MEDARMMTGGAAIVDALIANSVTSLFGLPGVQMYPLFDALQQRSDKIRTYGARHEQTCAYMAFGYARSTGRPGVYSVVPGPGVLNTSAAVSSESTIKPRLFSNLVLGIYEKNYDFMYVVSLVTKLPHTALSSD